MLGNPGMDWEQIAPMPGPLCMNITSYSEQNVDERAGCFPSARHKAPNELCKPREWAFFLFHTQKPFQSFSTKKT